MFSFEGFDPFGLALARLGHRRSKPVQDAFKREFFHFVIVTSQQERLCLISLNWCPVVGFLYFIYYFLSFVCSFVLFLAKHWNRTHWKFVWKQTNKQNKNEPKHEKKMAPSFLFSSFFFFDLFTQICWFCNWRFFYDSPLSLFFKLVVIIRITTFDCDFTADTEMEMT